MTKSSTKGSAKDAGLGGRSAESTASPLQSYREKRDPLTTREPFSAERLPSPADQGSLAAGKGTWAGDFVVHLHRATRRHYDLRLQVGGRLLSFAVPKGPSLNPNDKRLAVQTEDHPIEYLDFEDVIPEGNYGAGAMIVWDIGRVSYLEHSTEDGLAKGKLDFLLYGRKLQGRFALVETGKREQPPPKQRQWLLIKKQDPFASDTADITAQAPHSVLSGLTVEELANKSDVAETLLQRAAALQAPTGNIDLAQFEPMLCANTAGNLHASGWNYELKLDGVRIIADKRSDQVVLHYRRSRSTPSYPEIARAVRALAPSQLMLDGEIVAFDQNGKPSFQRLAQRIHAQKPHDVKRAAAEIPVTYLVFDLLKLGDRDLRSLPLHARKELLPQLVHGKGLIRLLDHIEDDGRPLFALCEAQGLEGVVAKRRDAPYQAGPRRSGDWVKIKCQREDDFVIVGWTSGQGSRERMGALEIASFDGKSFIYRGRVGSGLDETLIDPLLLDFAPLQRAASIAVGDPSEDGGERHFLEPRLVASVSYLEWSDEGRLRQPVFRGMRTDVEPEACRAAPIEERIEQQLQAAPASAGGLGSPSGASASDWRTRAGRVALTNLDKVFWPDEGYTKGDLLEYYASIADVMLPHLHERPVMLVRYSDGITGKNFYQWNIPAGTPSWIGVLELRDQEQDGKSVATFLIDSVEALLHVINLGAIPLHVLASRKDSLEDCDFLTIDLDPGEQPFTTVVRLTLGLKEILDQLGLSGYVKTSGQAGMHVLIPLGPGVSFATAKVLVDLIGRLLQTQHPSLSTTERRISERGSRLFIDTGQTGRSRTIVAPYSVRAHPGATVSTPLYWEEVHMALNPHELTAFTVPDRIVDKGDPMRDLLAARPNVPLAITRLQAMFGL